VPRSPAAAAVLGALALAGCLREEEVGLPAACRADAAGVTQALERAPAPVRLDGIPLSGCLVRKSDPSDVQAVGASYLQVAVELAAAARTQPEGPAAVRLGYLIGAVRRGAAGTQGIHDELVRRLEQELVPLDTGTRAFRRGERAGRESG
jgi:hypothetical protein